jgi:hypothetical protein
MEALAKLSSELAQWYARRLKYLWITTVNQGLGFFVLYAVLVVFGVHLAREGIDLRARDENRLDQFLQSDHEVRDEDHFVSAVSVVLSAVDPNQRIRLNSCPAGSSECVRARSVLLLTVSLAQSLEDGLRSTDPEWEANAVELLNQRDVGEQERREVVNELKADVERELKRRPKDPDQDRDALPNKGHGATVVPSNEGSGARAGEVSSPLSLAAAAGRDSSDYVLMECGHGDWSARTRDAASAQRRETLGLAQPICQRRLGDVTGLLIPEQVAHIPRGDDKLARIRLQHAMYISSALEAALRSVLVQPPGNGCGPAVCAPAEDPVYSFVAAYFIGIDSVIRYWHVEPGEPIEGLPPYRQWAAREYFTQFLEPENGGLAEYVSRPYLDFAGAGIVQTICERVRTRTAVSLAELRDAGSEASIPGIVCVDLALRRAEVGNLVGRIQDGPFVSAGLLRIDADGAATIESQPNKNSAHALQMLIDSLEWKTVFKSSFVAGAASRSTTRVGRADDVWYVVPVGRIEKDQFAVALRPSLSSGVGRLWRWAILGAIFGAAFVLLTFTAQQSRRVGVAERDLARLRGLPTAVIECRPDPSCPSDLLSQRIIAGNDRAEEVLQTQLRNFGLSTGQRPLLSRLIDDQAIIEAAADGVTPVARIDGERIDASRRNGETTAYYVRLTEEKRVALAPPVRPDAPGKDTWPQLVSYRWLRIAAGPVVLPRWRISNLDARGRMESTVGIIVPVWEKALERDLESKRQSPKQGATRQAKV